PAPNVVVWSRRRRDHRGGEDQRGGQSLRGHECAAIYTPVLPPRRGRAALSGAPRSRAARRRQGYGGSAVALAEAEKARATRRTVWREKLTFRVGRFSRVSQPSQPALAPCWPSNLRPSANGS